MAREEVPVEREDKGEPIGVIEKHPGYGLIGLFRTQGTQKLFGSPLEWNNGYVTLKIHRGERCRSGHGYDHFFAGKTVVEVMLSEAQFAQLITSWNSGEGVPCTLYQIAGEGTMPSWPDEDQVSETERVREDFNNRLADLHKRVDVSVEAMEKILEKKGALTKDEKKQLVEGMRALSSFFHGTGPFMTEQFVEATEKTVQKALTEIDAFVTKVIHHTGLEALKELKVAGMKALDEGESEELEKHERRAWLGAGSETEEKTEMDAVESHRRHHDYHDHE